ncbi:hypothetical protein [Alicyclobacillus mengziensis]|uniref:Uncharacterized protein n=1 Tax=Alicyclobacillus mengziensis TaxID=2931921 RepID=A0A9X7W2N0_9BACL|nr:hypothetical protein [Alicyclobacillus mengziensis]QSO49551.1 hypothetical protein JZ786_12025 [Alicyclobacillus mengziensis]
MVEGPNLSIRPPVTMPRAPESITPTRGSNQTRSQGPASADAATSTNNREVSGDVAAARTLESRTTLVDMPLSILNSATLTRAEWGWRGFLSNFLAGKMAQLLMAPSTIEGQAQPASGQLHASAFQQQVMSLVSTMRQVMNLLATDSTQKSWETMMTGPIGSPTLVPFAHITRDTSVNQQSGTVQNWTLLDRIGAAVQDAQAPVFGSGMLLLPQGQDMTRAVKWRAHRSSQPTRAGQLVHRLVVDFQVRGHPARATLITSRPEMAVYVQTNDNRLRGLLESQRTGLQVALSGTGWNLEHFHVGSFEDDGGVMS